MKVFLFLKVRFLASTFVLKLRGQTSRFPLCLHRIFLLSLLNHTVEISDNIKHVKISNATNSVTAQMHSVSLLLVYYFNIAMSLPENVLRDTFILVKA